MAFFLKKNKSLCLSDQIADVIHRKDEVCHERKNSIVSETDRPESLFVMEKLADDEGLPFFTCGFAFRGCRIPVRMVLFIPFMFHYMHLLYRLV